MSKQPALTRRGLFGLFRPRPDDRGPGRSAGNADSATTGFSLEDFYRRRATDQGAGHPAGSQVPHFDRRAGLDARNIPTTRIGVPDLTRPWTPGRKS
jgi:hypothetical protein